MSDFANGPTDDGDFCVRGTRDGSGWTFIVRGDLDLVTVPRLRFALAEAFAGPVHDVVVDLQDVEFFEVTALHLFAEITRRLSRGGRRLFLRGLSPFQQRLLHTYGLTRSASGAWAERVTLA